MGLIALALLGQDMLKFPPHYGGVPMTCPVGGEAFTGPSLMHYSTFGALPDGQPIGSIDFPVLMPECPGNGMIIYDKFTPENATKLAPFVASPAYKAMRDSETSYYRAHWLAKSAGNSEQAAWLLLSATWQAKKTDPTGEQARRYNSEFVAIVRGLPADASSFPSIALRARAANALRELGRFDEAEAMRASVTMAPDAGGPEGKRNREGWGDYLARLAPPIARKDNSREPIDIADERMAVSRCLNALDPLEGSRPLTLTAFEAEFCAREGMKPKIEKAREARAKYRTQAKAGS
jgi:hypothetical protein